MESIVVKCKVKDLQKNILISNLVELLNKNAELFYGRKNDKIKFVDYDFIDRCYYQDVKELYNVITLYRRSVLFNDFGKTRNELMRKILENLDLLRELAVKEIKLKNISKIS